MGKYRFVVLDKLCVYVSVVLRAVIHPQTRCFLITFWTNQFLSYRAAKISVSVPERSERERDYVSLKRHKKQQQQNVELLYGRTSLQITSQIGCSIAITMTIEWRMNGQSKFFRFDIENLTPFFQSN